MATNEHFLLVNLTNVVGALDKVAFTIDEVIEGVRKGRLCAKLTGGSRTAPLVKKALRKLDYNNHIKFRNVDGQAGFHFTSRGITRFKRAIQDCPQRKRRAPRSSLSLRARDVLRIGSFLKKRLVKDSDDILEEMRESYLRGNDTAIEARCEAAQVSHIHNSSTPSHSLPSPRNRLYPSQSSASFQISDKQAGCYPSLHDVASESEAERLPSCISDSEQDQCLADIPDSPFGYPASSLQATSSFSLGNYRASPQSLTGVMLSLCDSMNGSEKDVPTSFFGALQAQDDQQRIGLPDRRFSLDSDKTLIDSSSLHDYFPVVNMASRRPRKRARISQDDDCHQGRSSSPESDLVSTRTPRSRYKRSTRQGVPLGRRRTDALNSSHFRPNETADETSRSGPHGFPRRATLVKHEE